jgi:hypothetical protein
MMHKALQELLDTPFDQIQRPRDFLWVGRRPLSKPVGQPYMIYQTADDVRSAGLAKWAHPHCRCGAPFGLFMNVQTNGVHNYKLRCMACGWGIGGAIAYDSLPIEVREAIPGISRPTPDRACARCGEWRLGVEWHHWAPRQFFADADAWPQSWLCLPCHREWHRTMRTQRKVSDKELRAYDQRPGLSWSDADAQPHRS